MTLPSKPELAWFGVLLLLGSELGRAEPLRILAPDLPGASEVGGSGRDAETVRQVLARCGYQAEFTIQPFGRHLVTYRESDKADAVMTVPLGQELAGASTAAYIWYQNGAVYDANRIGPLDDLDDLRGLDLVTFKNGIQLLELDELEPELGNLFEIANQRIHSHLLLLGRVDAILADGLIVSEVNRQILTSETRTLNLKGTPALRFAPIFTPAPYKMVFRKRELAEAFDACYDEAWADGVVYEINEKYIGPFQQELGHRYLGF